MGQSQTLWSPTEPLLFRGGSSRVQELPESRWLSPQLLGVSLFLERLTRGRGFRPDRTKSMVEGRRRSSTVLSPLLLLLKRMLMTPSSRIMLPNGMGEVPGFKILNVCRVSAHGTTFFDIFGKNGKMDVQKYNFSSVQEGISLSYTHHHHFVEGPGTDRHGVTCRERLFPPSSTPCRPRPLGQLQGPTLRTVCLRFCL